MECARCREELPRDLDEARFELHSSADAKHPNLVLAHRTKEECNAALEAAIERLYQRIAELTKESRP